MTGSDTRPDDPRGEGQYGGAPSMSIKSTPKDTPRPSYADPSNDPYAERRGGGGRNKGGLIKKKKKK